MVECEESGRSAAPRRWHAGAGGFVIAGRFDGGVEPDTRGACAPQESGPSSRRGVCLKGLSRADGLVCLRSMLKAFSWLALAGLAGSLGAAERKFDFSGVPTNQPPTNCVSLVAGAGKPGDWRVLLDEVPLEPDAFQTNAGRAARKSVVAQLSRDTSDQRYPLLVLGNEGYGNFTFTARFKMVDGLQDQAA